MLHARTRSPLPMLLATLLAALPLAACDDDGGSTGETDTADTSLADTAQPDGFVPDDTDDTTPGDTTAGDTSTADTGTDDTGTDDTGTDDTGDDLVTGAPLLFDAGLCDIPASPGLSLQPGTDLWRVTADLATHPQAVCNDGSPAVFYVSPAPAGSADADKWIVWLEGGGGCNDAAECVDRWCGRHPIYTAAKMSSRWAPEGIRGLGLFDRDPGNGAATNHFAGYNHVVAYYCTSDNWSGTTAQTLEDPDTGLPFAMHLAGEHVVDALIDRLRQGATSDGGEVTMPDLDAASQVLFAGTSAGGGGARFNADRVGAVLLGENPALDYRLVVDAGVYPSEADPPDITEERAEMALDVKWDVFSNFRGATPDASCLAFHADDPRPCADNTHLLVHHIATPWFVKMDLSDNANAPGLYPDVQTFGRATHAMLTALAYGSVVPEEPEALDFPVGIFAPNCGHHVNLEAGVHYAIALAPVDAGPALTTNDVLWNWVDGAEPMTLIHNPPEGIESVCP